MIEIANILWPKVAGLSLYFSKLQTPQVKYLPEFLIVTRDYVSFYFYLWSIVENVALLKRAYKSGTFHRYSTAVKAIDGNTNGETDDGSCAHPGMIYGHKQF